MVAKVRQNNQTEHKKGEKISVFLRLCHSERYGLQVGGGEGAIVSNH